MMTQGSERISLAQKPIGVSRRLSVAVAMFALAAFLMGTAGTSFAKDKKNHKNKSVGILDTIIVANGGAGTFAGSLATFLENSHPNTPPFLWVKGPDTLLDAASAPAGVAVSSFDAHIATANPLNLLGVDGLTDGFALIFGPGSNGNTPPETIIGTPFPNPDGVIVTLPVAPNTTGIDTDQGVAFENPHDGVNPGSDILAVADELPVVVGPDSGTGACAAPPDGFGLTIGIITEFDRNTLVNGLNDVPPFNNSPVTAASSTADAPIPFYSQNATIGGCDTFLAGPIALRYDQFGFLYVLNVALLPTGPAFVTVYAPGAFGDAPPVGLIGLEAPTLGDFIDPVKIAVASDPTDPIGDVIFVTDVGDSSVKIFAPFDNGGLGALLGTIAGGHTKFRRPTGVAYSDLTDTLYVTNALANTVSEFTDATLDDEAGGNISPTLTLISKKGLNSPVDVDIDDFTPSPTATATATASATATGTASPTGTTTPTM